MTTLKTDVQAAFESLVNQKATIFKYGEMGFPHSIMCEIKSVYRKDYAQYNNMLHIVYRPKGKRSDYVMRIYDYSSFLLYAGHVVLNAEMWVKKTESNGCILSESLLSFDNGYMTRAIESTDKARYWQYSNNLFLCLCVPAITSKGLHNTVNNINQQVKN